MGEQGAAIMEAGLVWFYRSSDSAVTHILIGTVVTTLAGIIALYVEKGSPHPSTYDPTSYLAPNGSVGVTALGDRGGGTFYFNEIIISQYAVLVDLEPNVSQRNFIIPMNAINSC